LSENPEETRLKSVKLLYPTESEAELIDYPLQMNLIKNGSDLQQTNLYEDTRKLVEFKRPRKDTTYVG